MTNITHNYKLLLISLLVLLNSWAAFSQDYGLGTWNVFNIKYNQSAKWSFFAEAQLRSLKYYDHFHYYEYKGGFNYQANKNFTLSLAAGSYDTYADGGNFVKPKNNDEFRLWPMATLVQSLGKFKIEHRYRAELRFTSQGYRNRFRYRLGLTYPLSQQKGDYYPLQLSISNEIFFTDTEPYFERNRAFISLLYRVSKHSMFQVGYLQQFDYKINDETGRDFVVMAYYLELWRKQKQNQ